MSHSGYISIIMRDNNVAECAAAVCSIADNFVIRYLAQGYGSKEDFTAYVKTKVGAMYACYIDYNDVIEDADFKEAVAALVHIDCDDLLDQYLAEDEALNA